MERPFADTSGLSRYVFLVLYLSLSLFLLIDASIVFQDVKPLMLSQNTTKLDSKVSSDPTYRAQFICPFTMKEMNGSQPFVYLWTCGCVFSLAGYKTMADAPPSGGSPKDTEEEQEQEKREEQGDTTLDLCPQCQTKYSRTSNIITLNPSPQEEEKLRETMDRQRSLEPPKKKSKKRKTTSTQDDDEPPHTNKNRNNNKKQRTEEPFSPPILQPTTSSSKTLASELAMEEAKRKATMTDALKSLYGEGMPKKKETFMTMGTFTRVRLHMLRGVYLTDDWFGTVRLMYLFDIHSSHCIVILF